MGITRLRCVEQRYGSVREGFSAAYYGKIGPCGAASSWLRREIYALSDLYAYRKIPGVADDEALNLLHQALEAWIARVSHPSSSVSKKGLKSCMFPALDVNPRVEDRGV
jgi:hypothetical protein